MQGVESRIGALHAHSGERSDWSSAQQFRIGGIGALGAHSGERLDWGSAKQ